MQTKPGVWLANYSRSFGGYGGQYWLGQAVGWARWYGINFAGAAGNDNKDTSDDWPW